MADADARTETWPGLLGLLSRRSVVLPALLVGLTLGAAVFFVTPKTYVTTSTMVLMTTEYGSTASDDPLDPTELSNPLLSFNDSLRTTSAMIIQSMGTKDVADQLDARGSTTLTIDDGRSNPDLLGLNGPFIFIKGESTTPEAASLVVREATSMARTMLKDWQESLSAPDKTFVGLVDVVPPTAPERTYSTAIKYSAAAGLAGFLICMAFAFVGLRVRGRRGPADDEAIHGENEVEAEPTVVRTLRSR